MSTGDNAAKSPLPGLNCQKKPTALQNICDTTAGPFHLKTRHMLMLSHFRQSLSDKLPAKTSPPHKDLFFYKICHLRLPYPFLCQPG